MIYPSIHCKINKQRTHTKDWPPEYWDIQSWKRRLSWLRRSDEGKNTGIMLCVLALAACKQKSLRRWWRPRHLRPLKQTIRADDGKVQESAWTVVFSYNLVAKDADAQSIASGTRGEPLLLQATRPWSRSTIRTWTSQVQHNWMDSADYRNGTKADWKFTNHARSAGFNSGEGEWRGDPNMMGKVTANTMILIVDAISQH